MTMADTPDTRPKGPGIDVILIGFAVVVAIGLLMYFSSQRQPALRSGATGFDGLVHFLRSEDADARIFTGGWSVNADAIGLNIVPVFDTKPDVARNTPRNERELLMQSDENDLQSWEIRARAEKAKTLIILPKWRSGVRLTGIAHPLLLIRPRGNQGVLDNVTGATTGNVAQVPTPFKTYAYDATDGRKLTARLYTPQTFAGRGCDPIIGEAGAMILARCTLLRSDDPVYILSDPDLLNNHGLRLGDNAFIAKDILSDLAGDKPIQVDYAARDWLIEDDGEKRPPRGRTWADLLRFFEPPFLTLWLSAAAAMALILWRSGVRFGPLPRSVDGPDASKRAAIDAQARLYRLTGQDGALLREYLPARLAHIANRLFGTSARGSDADMIRAHLKRHAPDLAQDFDETIHRINQLPHNISAQDAIAQVDNLERILEKITHDT